MASIFHIGIFLEIQNAPLRTVTYETVYAYDNFKHDIIGRHDEVIGLNHEKSSLIRLYSRGTFLGGLNHLDPCHVHLDL